MECGVFLSISLSVSPYPYLSNAAMETRDLSSGARKAWTSSQGFNFNSRLQVHLLM